MLRVGLTGNIGSGKSLVADALSHLGIAVYKADDEAKKFLQKEELIKLLTEEFGKKILNNKGEIERKKLAEEVFTDKGKLNKLNHIIHPFVIADFEDWCAGMKEKKYVIIEAAILFESGYDNMADKIITVTCPEEIRIKRIIKRDNVTKTEVKQRMDNQWDERIKAEKSDFVIVNDGEQMLVPQIVKIHEALMGSEFRVRGFEF